ncbi:hypothetical protein [Leucothrix arctica]|uniref:Uncharacterized protein n=1 Tax=Leucothrix arctica TaxID=1481894 RepID=A0A317C464_9GAMM|nr:hypothetical protein [Leucothrix arctica]PWQ92981.1 hypothetical protein DKT75_21620 [Leucothrix arctica]
MEIAVLIAAIIGITLFVISYLKFAFEGFRFHVITGLLALIPVLNLIALPTLWDRTNKWLILGIIGLAVAAGSWFAGAGNTFQSYWGGNHNTAAISSPVTVVNGSAIGANTNTVTPNNNQNTAVTSQERFLTRLPSKALYRLDFESVPANNIQALVGRIVRITDVDHNVTDGRITSLTASSVFIEQYGDGQIAYEMMLGNIKSVEVMVQKAAR